MQPRNAAFLLNEINSNLAQKGFKDKNTQEAVKSKDVLNRVLKEESKQAPMNVAALKLLETINKNLGLN